MSTPRWITALLIAVAAALAAVISFAITITPLGASPVFLVSGVGVVLLARFGRGLWPALAVGDAVGEFLITDRSPGLIALVVVLHVLIALAGATWMVDHRAWPGDLQTSVRFLLGASVLSVVEGACFGALSWALAAEFATPGIRDSALWAIVGVLVGFLVGGTSLAAWLRPPWRSPGSAVVPSLATIVVGAAAVAGLAGPVDLAAPVALLGTLAIAARYGRRWASPALVLVAACALVGADRGMAPMGGTDTTGAVANVMIALALIGGFVLLLGAYRRGGAAATRPVATTALLFAGMMLVAGIAGVGSNEVVVSEDAPLVIAGMFTAISAIGLLIVRAARPVTERLSRSARGFAIAAGGLYALNLGLLFAAMPLIGAGAATALAMISPLPVVVLSVIFLRLRTSWAVAGAVAIIVAGAVVAAVGSLASPLGIALAMLSAVAFAASVICTRAALRSGGIIEVALVSTTTGAIAALAGGAIVSGPAALLIPQEQLRLIALAALGAQLVPILGRTWALQHMGPDLVGAEGVLAPASTALLSFWLISPPEAPSQWIGLIIIAVGAVLAALAGGRVAQAPRNP